MPRQDPSATSYFECLIFEIITIVTHTITTIGTQPYHGILFRKVILSSNGHPLQNNIELGLPAGILFIFFRLADPETNCPCPLVPVDTYLPTGGSSIMQLASTIQYFPASSSGRTSRHRLAALVKYRELLWMLAWRDIRVRYKHSLLGAAWAVLPPVLMMLIFSFVFGTMTQMKTSGLTGHPTMPYSLFAFAGLVPWTFFANGLSNATLSLVSNRQLVTKIYFPREVFPFSAIISAVVDFLIAAAVLILYAIGLRLTHSSWSFELHAAIAWLPLVVLVQIILMLGLSLILSMANLFYRDVGFLFRSLIQLWMFFTCVLYQLDATTGWKRVLIQLNPMTPIIRAFRDCLFLGRSPFDVPFAVATLSAIIILLLGWRWFGRSESRFAECI